MHDAQNDSQLIIFLSFAYTKAKVEQEKDVERHVDLQSEVLVEVLARLDRTVRGRDMRKKKL